MFRMKAATAAILSVMVIACLLPVMSQDSDAESYNSRMSDMYVHRCEPIDRDTVSNYQIYFNSSMLYFIEGSANEARMTAYLDDPVGTSGPSADDQEMIENNAGDYRIIVYALNSYSMSSTYVFGREVKCTQVLEPYGKMGFFVKAGDTIRIELVSAVDNMGNKVNPRINYDYESYSLADRPFVLESPRSQEISLYLNSYPLYADISLEVTGNSVSNGSAGLFIGLCALVTVIVFGILILASIKPKWSK